MSTIHHFDSTGEAYHRSQTDDEIKHGHVVVVASERAIAVMDRAWPIAVTLEHGEFLTPKKGVSWPQFYESMLDDPSGTGSVNGVGEFIAGVGAAFAYIDTHPGDFDKVDLAGVPVPKTDDHRARPDDDPEPGDRCHDCGLPVTWIGPNQTDWRHGSEIEVSPVADSITIELDGRSKAFYSGLAAGDEATAQLAQLPAGTGYDAQVKYFWLKVGTELAQRIPGADDDLVMQFVAGANLRQPERPDPPDFHGRGIPSI